MTSAAGTVEQLVRAGRAAVGAVKARAHLDRAWEALQERDADGNVCGVRPWTDTALAELAAARAADPDDVGIVHHLAVAQHARAWDLELRGDPGAAAAWREALEHWRVVAASPAFWAGLERKLLACDPQADPAPLAAVRHDLLSHLLDVHVEFVRRYLEADDLAGARRHVEVVRRASFPEALRKQLVGRVFAGVAAAALQAVQGHELVAALTLVERFLAVFLDYLPALRLHAELAKKWVDGLSYQSDWPAILEADRRAAPVGRALAAHPELAEDALARAALTDLAGELALRGTDRAGQCSLGRNYADLSRQDRDTLAAALTLAITWGRLAEPHSPSGARVRELLAVCLQNQGYFWHQEAEEVRDAHTGKALALYRRAVAVTQEALNLRPEHEGLRGNLKGFQEQVIHLELFDDRGVP